MKYISYIFVCRPFAAVLKRYAVWCMALVCMLLPGISRSQWADSCSSGSFYGEMISTKNSLFIKAHPLPGGHILAVGMITDSNTVTGIKNIYTHIMRLNSQGQKIWSKFLGRTDAASYTAAVPLASTLAQNGDLVTVIERTDPSQAGNGHIIMARLNGNGAIVWQKILPNVNLFYNPTQDQPVCLLATSDGGFVTAGPSVRDGIILKIDAQGELLWTNRITSPGQIYYEDIRDVAESPAGYYSIGLGSVNAPGVIQNCIIRFNKITGDAEWLKAFYFPASSPPWDHPEYLFSKLQIINGELLLTGSTYPYDLNAPGYALAQVRMFENATAPHSAIRIQSPDIEMDPFATLYKGTIYDAATRTGVQYRTYNNNPSDYHLFRLDAALNKTWAWKIPLPGNQLAMDLSVLTDSSVIIAGANIAGGNPTGGHLLKTAPDGRLQACQNMPYQVSTVPVTVMPMGDPDPLESPNFTLATQDATLIMYDGFGFTWQLQCDSSVLSRLGIITGPPAICKDSIRTYTVKRSGTNNAPVIFTTSGTAQVAAVSDTSATIRFTAAGNYTIYARMQAACGLLQDSLAVTVSNPAAPFSLGNDTLICTGNTITLQAPAGFISYLWQDGSGQSAFTASAAGTYHLAATDACGNTFRDTMIVTTAAAPAFTAGPDRLSCNGDTVQLTASPGFNGYQWQPAYQLQQAAPERVVVNPLVDTFYTVTALAPSGCRVADTVRIAVRAAPPLLTVPDTALCQGDTLILNTLPGYSNIQWGHGPVSAAVVITQPGKYTVTARYGNGCIAYDTVQVNTRLCLDDIFIPAGFTPNNDGVNDVFKAIGHVKPEAYRLKIYNRWGAPVFETRNIGEGWNGTYKGAPAPPGAYAWVCEYRLPGLNRKVQKGTVVLIR